MIGPDGEAAQAAFAGFLDGKTATADQIQFVQLVIKYLARHGVMSPDLLFEPPFTNNAPKGISSVFDNAQAHAVIDVMNNSTTPLTPANFLAHSRVELSITFRQGWAPRRIG